MAVRKVNSCDKCKKDIPQAPRTMSIYLDRTYNGTDHDNEYLALDLCHPCSYNTIEKLFSDSDGKTNKEILKQLGISH